MTASDSRDRAVAPRTTFMALILALALKAALTIFSITFKRKKVNKINNSYNNKLIITYV